MNRIAIGTLLSILPLFALAADGSLTFAPPASDVSVVFLGNLFGVVDGVLHGTGSQIMGSMFGVFNSAVLALGGIIIMYTLIVSTMNTAHEGQMLGQKWSSIWIPVRSTAGLALLIPKASGYCMMQIFVMWLVVQGVGAADKVWEAALSYLNRGGVIIQAQSNPTIALTSEGNSGIASGGLNILAGQVCMLGLQKQLESQRQGYLNSKQKGSGPCNSPSGDMKIFCDSAVPDFISTVNTVMFQNQNKAANSFRVSMPNFDTGSPFNFLNGICGSISWNAVSDLGSAVNQGSPQSKEIGNGISLSSNELQTAQMTRAIAVQQMYLDLSSIAQIMVNNDPQIAPPMNSGGAGATTPYSLVANQQFGVPYTKSGNVCSVYDQTCVTWGPASGSAGGVLFNGSEFQGAIADYNGIMMPTLNLINQKKDSQTGDKGREFIKEANSQGWLMAGSYFFDLVRIQGSATRSADLIDNNTGLGDSQFDTTLMLAAFGDSGCTGKFAKMCTWFNENNTKVKQVAALIDGSQLTTSSGVPVASNAVPKPNLKSDPKRAATSSLAASTVYGFINNSVMQILPGQPVIKPFTFANSINFSVDPTMVYLQEQSFPCGAVKIGFFSFCLGQLMGNIFYNLMFRYIYNFFLTIFQQIINQVVMAFLMIPLNGMADIFKVGVRTLSEPGVNPIVALANMGAQYINFSGNLWIMLLNLSVTSSIIPIFGFFIYPLIMLAMPLLLAWVGIMVSIGFVTAYYIPLLPYMIFTFGVIAWLMAVIEAMVAAPIVALGVTHPEGHDAFGKGEPAIMILMNVFLRPAMMIIGYIAAIALSYVGVWILNAGFEHAISFIQTGRSNGCESSVWGWCDKNWQGTYAKTETVNLTNALPAEGSGSGGYTEWAGIYAFFFSILSYTTMYLIIVQRAFSLIAYLPDKVLRWIGGSPEGIGEQAAQWGEELKQSGKEAGKPASDAMGTVDKQLGGYGQKAVGGLKSAAGQALGGGGSVTGKGTQGSDGGDAPPTPPTP